jgi:hypothetical protein
VWATRPSVKSPFLPSILFSIYSLACPYSSSSQCLGIHLPFIFRGIRSVVRHGRWGATREFPISSPAPTSRPSCYQSYVSHYHPLSPVIKPFVDRLCLPLSSRYEHRSSDVCYYMDVVSPPPIHRLESKFGPWRGCVE